MVRSLHYGPHFSEKLTELSAKGFSTGLVLGSHLGDRAFGVCLVETPVEAGEKTENPEAETKRSTSLDVGWMEEHARQVYRLLPGRRSHCWPDMMFDIHRRTHNPRLLCLPPGGRVRQAGREGQEVGRRSLWTGPECS